MLLLPFRIFVTLIFYEFALRREIVVASTLTTANKYSLYVYYPGFSKERKINGNACEIIFEDEGRPAVSDASKM